MSRPSGYALDVLRLHSTLHIAQPSHLDIAGQQATTRLAGVEDWPLIDGLHDRCSAETMHLRWGRYTVRQRDWNRLCLSAVPLVTQLPDGDVIALVSVGPVSQTPDAVDLGIQVADAWQRRGLGSMLARHSVRLARAAGARLMTAQINASNRPMLKILRALDAELTPPSHGQVESRIDLSSPVNSP